MKVFLRNTEECEVYIAKVEKALRKAGIDVVKKEDVTDGLSPADWIEQYIVAQAQQLLKTHPSMTIQEISFMPGFNEPATFCRYYKRVTGQTAKRYRNEARILSSLS